ncbi:arylsulfotransferase family protein [Parasphingorhabdus halotolerans]|uniref:Uncharacterized protein n=1 Tax=Parasphingorhabdus halotolerans TaxID=2725558 RepID=A0A6H2DNM5_9SPHN|nr:arylsulfotransferase family protein [Parasphingorhabdus halotolerans]QJB69737.1 hypothetical protein HF685_10995 [Parasphingorhabdus halotolerans]
MVAGGISQFLDICPSPGCLAVQYDRKGNVVRKWPLKSSALLDAKSVVEGKFSYGGNDPTKNISVVGLQMFKNGDLLVSLALRNSFPYGWGLARIDSEGNVVWRKRDFYHHWAKLTVNGDIYSPFYEIRDDHQYQGVPKEIQLDLICPKPDKQFADFVHVLGHDGRIKKRIDLVRLVANNKRYNSLLARSRDSCDPLHLNFVDVASPEEAAETDWLETGDMLLSFKAISAVMVISADGQLIKRAFSGSFAVQHSAQFVENGKILLFDNMGASESSLSSRLIQIDLKDGSEKVLYSRQNPAEYSINAGNISLSADGKRALLSYTRTGHAIELELTTGKRISTYDHAHPIPATKNKKQIFYLFGAWFVKNDR